MSEIVIEPHMPSWKTIDCPDFTRLLHRHCEEAHMEMGMSIIKIFDSNYTIYPKLFYKRIDSMPFTKEIDFCFIGQKNVDRAQQTARTWSDKFATERFGPRSYLQYNGEDSNYVKKGEFDYTNVAKGFIPRDMNDDEFYKFDEHYFTIMKKSKFCLCPAGDAPWSMRFLEAIMCKTIPIVSEKYETWRTYAEEKLDYKFYYAHESDFVYREDWVAHNYDIFLQYHTFEYYDSPICVSNSI